jgi:hypothetical protein
VRGLVAGGTYRAVLLPVAWQSGSMVAAAIHILVPTDVEKIRKDVASMCDMPNLSAGMQKLPVKCQDIDDPSLTVKRFRTSMTLPKHRFNLSGQLVLKSVDQIVSKIDL